MLSLSDAVSQLMQNTSVLEEYAFNPNDVKIITGGGIAGAITLIVKPSAPDYLALGEMGKELGAQLNCVVHVCTSESFNENQTMVGGNTIDYDALPSIVSYHEDNPPSKALRA